jgi:hypothetical protein
LQGLIPIIFGLAPQCWIKSDRCDQQQNYIEKQFKRHRATSISALVH